ncbi:MAG: hypothetical protein O4805_20570 [Trichodesmium sp. St16_bin2-tuft]|nr:hypothetical protein [Trichodesmium sp. St16_bin2-tuft]MDE5117936.1 hypothetical protein [Trichodesmium sp. St2_bin2_1]
MDDLQFKDRIVILMATENQLLVLVYVGIFDNIYEVLAGQKLLVNFMKIPKLTNNNYLKD